MGIGDNMHGHFISETRKLNKHYQSGGIIRPASEQLVIYQTGEVPSIGQHYWDGDGNGGSYENSGIQWQCGEHEIKATLLLSDLGSFPGRIINRPILKIAQSGCYQLKYDLTFVGLGSAGSPLEEDIVKTDGIRANENSGIISAFMEMPGNYTNRNFKPMIYPARDNQVYQGAYYNYVAGDTNATISSGMADNVLSDGNNIWVTPYRETPSYGTFQVFRTKHYYWRSGDIVAPPIIFNIKKGPYKHVSVEGNSYIIETSRAKAPKIQINLHLMDFAGTLLSSYNNVAVYGKIWLERIGDYVEDQVWDPYIIE